MKLQNEIPKFLATKSISRNSKSSYTYDLTHFSDFFAEREINEAGILLFRKSLEIFSTATQQRKISANNQFLLYLYKNQILQEFFQVPKVEAAFKTLEVVEAPQLRDFSSFYGPIQTLGQFLATLILETGLTPSQICRLKWNNFNWRFNLLEISEHGMHRAIPLQNKFAVRAKVIQNADELFSKSRQFLHVE
ncbi:MAG: site-specific tyrosine recombinase XerD, partial [Streptococcaceae bacterium]|nr:site-specific tyrosine recombinase XerD [Streptococcaceae bacterium]